MSEKKPNLVNVTMVRDNLEGIPELELPAPYTLRLYKEGDAKAFDDIWTAADVHGQAYPGLFEKEFHRDIAEVPRRMFFVCDGSGRPVATATAWFNSDLMGAPYGVVHWVAVVPEEQGKGLSKPLMSAVLKRLRDLGHDKAYLITQTVRLTAINLYKGLGFKPYIKTEADAAHWEEIKAGLARMKRGA